MLGRAFVSRGLCVCNNAVAVYSQSVTLPLLNATQIRFKHREGKGQPHFSKHSKMGVVHQKRVEFDPFEIHEKSGGEYTTRPLAIRRTGGRDLFTNEKLIRHLMGGVRFDYFMVDTIRGGPEGDAFYEEKVLEVRRDPTWSRKVYIALVGGANGNRWLLATENMVAGNIIRSSRHLPDKLVEHPCDGDSYPVGALEPGTELCQLEKLQGQGHKWALGPGASLQLNAARKEFAVRRECQCVVGQMSHADWNKKWLGSPNMKRRFGVRQATGERMKKNGYFGRKNRKPPPVQIWDETSHVHDPPAGTLPVQVQKEMFTLTKQQVGRLHNHHNVHPLMQKHANFWRFD